MAVKQAIDRDIRRFERTAPDAGLAVDAQAQFDLRFPQCKAWQAGCRHRAGGKRHAHGADRACRGPGGGGDVGQRGSCLRDRTRNLVDQNCPRQTAPTRALGRTGQRRIVGHKDGLDRDPLGLGNLRREAEVQTVAGVVLDDQERTARPDRGAESGQDGVGAGGGEHVAGNGGAQHPAADITCVRWLVAATPA
jgi:hypothetical protein